MSNVLKRPARRKKLKQRETSDDEQENKFIENFQQIKKKRTERKENAKTISMLFDKLNQTRKELEQEGYYGVPKKEKESEDEAPTIESIQFDDDYMLNSDQSSDEEESAMLHAAKLYLDEDAQENIQTAIDEAKNSEVVESKDCWNQKFFTSGTKNIRQPALISRELGIGQKEIHISELSASSKGRSYLLSSGCMKDWHRSGWICPNYIYQWLFEVVGLELNKMVSKNALSTLFTLWSLPGTKVNTKLPHIYKQRYITLDTFKSVLTAFDAIPSQLLEGVLAPPEDEELEMVKPDMHNTTSSRYIPLSQLGWMIKAFSFSVRLWSKAYTSYEIRHTIRLLLQLSLDKTGYLVMQEIQTAIDNCLSAMRETTWETEIKTIANDICDIVPSTKRQVHLLDSVKTNYERSRFLRRVIGVTCLERCLDLEVPGSVDYILTDQSIVQQIFQIFNHPQGFFLNRENIDYEEVCIRVAMLDAAIGIDDDEIKRDKKLVLEIAAELRNIGLGIGSRLGVMKKTLANEMIQRVWSRISYVVGAAANYA